MADVAWLIGSTGIIALLILIGIVTLWRTLKEKKSGFPSADERTQKINGKQHTTRCSWDNTSY